MIPDSRRQDLERELLLALQQGAGSPAQRLMAPGVQEALQQLFLDQSDGVLHALLGELSAWQAAERSGPSDAVLRGLQRLRGLAQDHQLDAIRGLSEALHQALIQAGAPDTASPSVTVADCQQGAEELARLLFLYAAGQRRDASSEVMARLQR
ncbi:MAG: hypothetical protein EBS37_03795 [Betaproteobacteria bacterium]|nr:hypothetical protein [Betaproteobacteria bacterium]